MNAEVHPVVKVCLTRSDVFFDEQFRALLHLVDETGSIPDSCQRMGIPLPAAWSMLAQAEDSLGFPLLRHLPDRSVLTEKGRKLLDALDGFGAAVQASADRLFKSFPWETDGEW